MFHAVPRVYKNAKNKIVPRQVKNTSPPTGNALFIWFWGRLVHCVTALWEQLSPLFQGGLFPPEQSLGIAGQINKGKMFPAQVYVFFPGICSTICSYWHPVTMEQCSGLMSSGVVFIGSGRQGYDCGWGCGSGRDWYCDCSRKYDCIRDCVSDFGGGAELAFCGSCRAYGQYGSALLYEPQCAVLRAARRHESERLMTFCQAFGQ